MRKMLANIGAEKFLSELTAEERQDLLRRLQADAGKKN
jgi:hypothetical protein